MLPAKGATASVGDWTAWAMYCYVIVNEVLVRRRVCTKEKRLSANTEVICRISDYKTCYDIVVTEESV